MSKVVDLQGNIIEDNTIGYKPTDGITDHYSYNDDGNKEYYEDIIDNSVTPVIKLDIDSTKDIEDHMDTLPNSDDTEDEYLSSISNLKLNIVASDEMLDEIINHLKELSDHYGYDFPEDMICDLLNNERINIDYTIKDTEIGIDDIIV